MYNIKCILISQYNNIKYIVFVASSPTWRYESRFSDFAILVSLSIKDQCFYFEIHVLADKRRIYNVFYFDSLFYRELQLGQYNTVYFFIRGNISS